ncbi:nineteen complex-related protein 2-domain-containing protein [Coniella lustricola]|uniref:Nineteen complex-related protein 2-domain-containing protein n=1 Tax=Coniella lustricola TaxID=2025994 RepID=A0A2T3A5U7_9PEZI|nr:nineteen complex-related protein 2-domain-containing protein [Coniella lustricola]
MFGAKRKARKIQVSEENEEPAPVPASTLDESMKDAPNTENTTTPVVKFARRPAKSSSLRRTVNISDDQDVEQPGIGSRSASGLGHHENGNEEDDARPAVIRPSVNRSGSSKLKKKGPSSRLSFGVAEDAGDAPSNNPTSSSLSSSAPPKKNPSAANLAQRAAENSAVRASLPSSSRNLPTRSFGVEPERPSYSKEYLEELQSSTPNAPRNLDALRIHDDGEDGQNALQAEAMALDAADLEGAVFVPSSDLPVSSLSGISSGHIPSAAEVREKKERRARLAKEGDAYNSDADEDDDGYISLLPKKKKDETRLIAEDEDLGEGYDEFVEDGRLQLGKSGDQAAKRQHRREMEELINAAEGDSEDEDTDSDAERKAAYEAAQTRAAMDGLHRLADEENISSGANRFMIPKMKPLPELTGSLARMRALLDDMTAQLIAKQKRVEEIEKEKKEILEREKAVQEILNQAGMKYQSAMGVKNEDVVHPTVLAAQSPLRTGGAPGLQIKPEERGLESFGTPTRQPEASNDEMEE